ncbi:MAG: phosphoribosylanthranilate isomerase [Gammaproteobacteria bacterium]|nr:phosphoribosylanthranilate isomerase [Gammaproteobacteria bacterium]
MRTRVKICGITRRDDALEAVRLGADAIGLVFYPPSPRAVSIERASEIVEGLPPFVTVVGLLVDPKRSEVAEILSRTRIDLLQFHGSESPEACEGHGRPYIKAIRMKEKVDLHALMAQYRGAAGLLLDTYRKGVPGGTGTSFDWDRIPADLADRIVLAGGLSADNIEEAVCRVKPFAVDVSGGVESHKGIKDAIQIDLFIRGVQRADW